MSNIIRKNNQPSAWKTQAYMIGAAAGALFGLVAAIMYSRAAEEGAQRNGGPNKATTGEVIGLGLASLAMVRQIAEMGKGPAKKR